MKLSFSLPSKSKPRVTSIADGRNAVDEEHCKEFVTEFAPLKSLTNSNPKYAIPPIENSWRPHKKMKNFDLPLQSTNTGSGLEFEPEVPSHGSNNITYGLNLRHKVKDGVEATSFESDATEEDRKLVPVEHLMLQSLRKDMVSLANDPTLEDFESVPVEGFGAALMAGYGWKPGKGIGKNAKEDVQIKEYKKWTAQEGLGFDIDRSKVVDRKAKLKETVKLDNNNNNRPRDINDGDLELNGKGKDKKSSKLISSSRGRERGSGSEIRGQTRERNVKPSWLRSHIKVRIVSKGLKSGRLYLKKGKIVDVVGPTTCDITMDETQELIQGVEQELLETALPRRGGPVLVLSGKHKGVYGNLVEKDLDKETGVVRDLDTHKILDVKLEQVAEYMGDLDDIEY